MLGYIDSFPFDSSIATAQNRGGSRAPADTSPPPRDPSDKVELGARGSDSAMTEIENFAKAHKRGLLSLFGLGGKD